MKGSPTIIEFLNEALTAELTAIGIERYLQSQL